jgi:hypothetical protein
MSKNNKAKIWIVNNSLLVRFEKIGSKSRFDLIRVRWQMAFPQSSWNEYYRAWELPVANLNDVKTFCEKMFWQVRVEASIPKHLQQLSLL